jgi:putative salt-induced outer membrane protein YdiY
MIYNHKNSLWILILILIDSPLLFASTLELSNGDRITGKLIKEENDTLFFDSEILGQITVKTAQGKVIDATTKIESVSKTEGVKSDKSPPPTKKSKWPNISTMFSDALPGKKLDSSITAGYRVGDGERNQRDLNLAFNIRHEVGKNQYFFDGRYDYSVQLIDDVSTANRDRYNVGFRWRRDISDHLFSQFDSTYLKDLVKEIDDDFKQSLGIGWRVFDKKSFELSITPALSGRFQRIPTVTADWVLLGTFFQDLRYKITDHITFYQDSDISINPDADDPLTFQISTRFQAQLSNRLVANLSYEIDFDENLRAGVDKTQERIFLGLGYQF